MSILNDIEALVTVAPTVIGYAATGQKAPYVCLRPLDLAPENAINGQAIHWDTEVSAYCAGASVEASFNLALLVIGQLHGVRVAETTLSTSLGYVGAQVEGHYETQVTIQLNQGGI